MKSQEVRNTLYELQDRFWWMEAQEWMVVDWLMAVNPDDFPRDRRYIRAKGRLDAFRFADWETSNMARA